MGHLSTEKQTEEVKSQEREGGGCEWGEWISIWGRCDGRSLQIGIVTVPNPTPQITITEPLLESPTPQITSISHGKLISCQRMSVPAPHEPFVR